MAVFDSNTARGKSVKNGKIIVVLKIGESLLRRVVRNGKMRIHSDSVKVFHVINALRRLNSLGVIALCEYAYA